MRRIESTTKELKVSPQSPLSLTDFSFAKRQCFKNSPIFNKFSDAFDEGSSNLSDRRRISLMPDAGNGRSRVDSDGGHRGLKKLSKGSKNLPKRGTFGFLFENNEIVQKNSVGGSAPGLVVNPPMETILFVVRLVR